MIGPHLPPSTPFQIIMKVYVKNVCHINVNEDSYVSILSLTSWQGLGYP